MADLVVQYWWHFDVEWKKIADIAVIPALLEVFSHVFHVFSSFWVVPR